MKGMMSGADENEGARVSESRKTPGGGSCQGNHWVRIILALRDGEQRIGLGWGRGKKSDEEIGKKKEFNTEDTEN